MIVRSEQGKAESSYTIPSLGNIAEQLSLKNELALLVFLTSLIRLIVLPANCLAALSARNIPYDVAAGCHVTLGGIASYDVDDVVEEVSFTVLTAEVLEQDIS